jgi:hypothetical protein
VRTVSADEAAISYKLYHREAFGVRGILEAELLRGFPPNDVERLRGALNGLVADKIVTARKTGKGRRIALGSTRWDAVYDQLKRFYDFLPSRAGTGKVLR